ncbi:restriction endonuclease subunit S [Pseudothermotoga sp. U03pept]|uniref:restriction endonuclease subunit S n=1 Tax=Pseudothermotoga sp. U03pept TaxID=3447012 RepID=UPI003F090805
MKANSNEKFKNSPVGRIPEEWEIKTLGEVCQITMGQSPPSESYNMEEIGIPFLQGKQEFGTRYPVAAKYTSEPLKIGVEGSILLSVRAPVGNVNIADRTYCIGRGLASLNAKKEIASLFLYYVLTFRKSNLEILGEGSTFQAISKSHISSFKIALPPLPEQRKIAEILETVDNAIEKTDAIIEKYKRIKEGLMRDLLTKGIDENGRIRDERTHKFKESPVGRIPEEWEVVDIYSHVNIINGGTPSTARPEFWNGTIPWLSVEDFNIGKRWVFSSSKYITELALKKSTTNLLKRGMLIISARGTVGVLAQLGTDMAFNQSCYGLDAKDKAKLSNDFLYYALKLFITSFLSLAYGNVFNTITRETFKKVLIPLPPLYEQQRIASILSQIDEVIEKEQAYKEKLERIKKGLMEDLLTGKVRVKHLVEREENER